MVFESKKYYIPVDVFIECVNLSQFLKHLYARCVPWIMPVLKYFDASYESSSHILRNLIVYPRLGSVFGENIEIEDLDFFRSLVYLNDSADFGWGIWTFVGEKIQMPGGGDISIWLTYYVSQCCQNLVVMEFNMEFTQWQGNDGWCLQFNGLTVA